MAHEIKRTQLPNDELRAYHTPFREETAARAVISVFRLDHFFPSAEIGNSQSKAVNPRQTQSAVGAAVQL
jgi:hypothetical protein